MGQSDLSGEHLDYDLQSQREPVLRKPLTESDNTRGPSIPVSAIIAILIQSLVTICLISLSVSLLVETREDYQIPPFIWLFLLSRLAVALGVLVGMRHRRYIARKVSRVLCTLGLIVGGVVVVYILTFGVTSLHEYTLLKVASAHCVVWISILACLATKSATDWFRE